MLEYWYLFPTGVLVAVVATSSSIGGSMFWMPIYLMVMGLDARVAFWMSLLTMLFGFGSGVWRNVRADTIDWTLTRAYLWVAAPAAALGAALSTRVPEAGLLLGFAAFGFGLGTYMLFDQWRMVRRSGRLDPDRVEPARQHERIYRGVGFLAGLLQGAVAASTSTMLLPCLLGHRRIKHHATAVGSTVVVVFVLSMLAVTFRIDHALWDVLVRERTPILGMLAFAGPGVILGGQLGPRLAQRMPRRWLSLYVGLLLLGVGGLVVLNAFRT
ncbi:MAG: sulfite exporter TauE/SafE family protein [Thermoanaerobaculia bacterium]|nr:sulfite exporter TauE/SafE family protein [Thermoanaerobaculia bacterium]